jgi:hypothetical protein
MRWVDEHVTRIGAKKRAYRLLVRNSEGNGYHGRLMRRWEDIKIDRTWFERTCREFIVEWTALISTVLKLQDP